MTIEHVQEWLEDIYDPEEVDQIMSDLTQGDNDVDVEFKFVRLKETNR